MVEGAEGAKGSRSYWLLGRDRRIYNQRFDEWLMREIEGATYSDVPSLATALADIVNKACGRKPLAITSVLVFMWRAFMLGRTGNADPSFSTCTTAQGE